MSFMQFEPPPSDWLKDLVQSLKWTYGALWSPGPDLRPIIGFEPDDKVMEWREGFYNSSPSASPHASRDQSRMEALFYSSYKSCSFTAESGYVGFVVSKRDSLWLTGSREVLDRAVLSQTLFLKSARIQTVMCISWNDNVLELGTTEQESRNEHILHQIQGLLACVANPLTFEFGSFWDSGCSESRDSMQLSPSTSTVSNDYNVLFGPGTQPVHTMKSHQAWSLQSSIFSSQEHFVNRGQVETSGADAGQCYQRIQQAIREEALLNRLKQDMLSTSSSTALPTPHDKGTSFLEWAEPGNSSSMFSAHGSGPASSGMEIPGTSPSTIPMVSTFPHNRSVPRQQHPLLADDILTSTDITLSLPIDIEMIQESNTIYGLEDLSTKNPNSGSREWPQLQIEDVPAAIPTQMMGDFSAEEVHRFQVQDPMVGGIDGARARADGWSEISLVPHHDHHSQITPQFPIGRFSQIPPISPVSVHRIDHPAPNAVDVVTTRLPKEHPKRHGESGWRTSFTTPKTWVRWSPRKINRYKSRDASGGPTTARLSQVILKKLLRDIIPKIATDYKAKDQERKESETSSGRARVSSYSTTPVPAKVDSTGQDPQARTHMLAERRRRLRENEHYAALRDLIPPTSRMDKATVLAETIHLVKKLKKRVRELEKGNLEATGTHNPSITSTFGGLEEGQIGSGAGTPHSSRGDTASPRPSGEVEEKFLPLKCEIESTPPKAAVDAPLETPRASINEEEDLKELVEVSSVDADDEEIYHLRAHIRTSHRSNIVLQVLTCLRDLALEVITTKISIEKQWAHADFVLKMSKEQYERGSAFSEEVERALQKSVFPGDPEVESNSDPNSQESA